MPPTALVAFADGCEEIEAVTPLDVLRRAGFDATSVAVGRETLVVGSHHIGLAADTVWDGARDLVPDVLVLPGGMPGAEALGAHDGLRELADKVLAKGGVVAALCAAPACTLAAWGLLAGRRATCYPGFESRFPADATYTGDPVTVDGRLVTGRGPGVALAFALAVVATALGDESARELAAQMQCA